jgi:hypothetical protein
MKYLVSRIFTSVVFVVLIGTAACNKSEQTANTVPSTSATVDRATLPIAEPTYPAITELDARKAKAPPIFEVKAPQGAPNVIVILLDNFGTPVPRLSAV